MKWCRLTSKGQLTPEGFSFHTSEANAELFEAVIAGLNKTRNPFEFLLSDGHIEKRFVTDELAARIKGMETFALQYGVFLKIDPSKPVQTSELGTKTLTELMHRK